MNISRFSIRHPAIIIILMVSLLLFGIIALTNMNQEFLPNVALPEITVITFYPGVGPEDIEREVTTVIEDELAATPSLTSIKSTSSDSVSTITLTFSDDVDLYDMLPEIRAKIDQLEPSLPSGIQGKPIALVAGVELIPIFSFAVVSDRSPQLVSEFIEDSLVPSINQLPGVSRVQFFGGEREEVFIELQLEEIYARGISTLQVYETLSYANVSLPAGTSQYRGQEMHVRISGEFGSLQEMRDLVVGSSNGELIYLRDIAEVSLRIPEPDAYIDSQGSSVLVVDVMKRDDGNTPDIIAGVKKVMAQVEESYGEVISFEILQDDSTMVRNSLLTVVRSGLMGVLMSVIVILLFLSNLRATLIIASSLPLTIVFSFIGMYLSGQTVNILTLSALVVALGMVVDSSIVILENVYRHFNRGQDKMLASEQGTREVSKAVLASITTSVSVFIPLLALTGIIGTIMVDLSLTLIFALTGSLIVSVVTIPFFTSKLLKRSRVRKRKPLMDLLMNRLARSYQNTLSWCLDHGRFVLLTAVMILGLTVLVLSLVGMSFIPSADTGEFYIYMTFPQGYRLEQSREKVLAVERIVRRDVPEVETAVFFTGYKNEFSRSSPAPHYGYGKVVLPSSRHRERSVHEIIRHLQYVIEEEVGDIDVLVENGGFDQLITLATDGTGFQVHIASGNYELLAQSAREVQAILERDPQVYKTTTSLDMQRETAIGDLALDHLGSLGFTSYQAALTSRILLHGEEVGTYRGTVGDRPIVLSSNLSGRALTEDVMEQVQLVDDTGREVSFSAFTKLRVEPTFATIERRDRMRTVVVTGYIYGEDLSRIRDRTIAGLEELNLPFGVTWSIGGLTDLMDSSIQQLLLIFGISIFLVYAVMVIQFERFTQPLIVMVSIPFCLIGVIFGLLLFGSTLSIVAFLGIIALGGIVVNNAIVLIDYINLLRKEREYELRDAVLRGSAQRLRPILMTTLTTFFGVLPLAFARGDGSEVYASLGQSIAGGIITSTLITLILIPLLYYLLEKRSKEVIEVFLEGEES